MNNRDSARTNDDWNRVEGSGWVTIDGFGEILLLPESPDQLWFPLNITNILFQGENFKVGFRAMHADYENYIILTHIDDRQIKLIVERLGGGQYVVSWRELR